MIIKICKKFIKQWEETFKNYRWIEAFTLSIICHIAALFFIAACCEFHVIICKKPDVQKIIEIEFVK